jgi:hypothetical protein
MTVPVPLKELLALSPDLRKHMKEAVTGKRVWGNLLTQAGPETPDAQADTSVNCFKLKGQDPEGIAREYGPKLTYSDDGRIMGNHSIPLRYIEATIVGTGQVVRCILTPGHRIRGHCNAQSPLGDLRPGCSPGILDAHAVCQRIL